MGRRFKSGNWLHSKYLVINRLQPNGNSKLGLPKRPQKAVFHSRSNPVSNPYCQPITLISVAVQLGPRSLAPTAQCLSTAFAFEGQNRRDTANATGRLQRRWEAPGLSRARSQMRSPSSLASSRSNLDSRRAWRGSVDFHIASTDVFNNTAHSGPKR